MAQSQTTAVLRPETIAALLKYPKMDSDGNLHALFPQKAKVVWKPEVAPDGILILEYPLRFYVHEMRFLALPEVGMKKIALPVVDEALRSVKALQALVSETNKPRLIKKVDKIAGLLSEVRLDMPPLMDSWVKEQAHTVIEEEGAWTRDKSEPITHLKLLLYWCLREWTTLTVENTKLHVLHLLKHFGIQKSVSETDLRSLDRTLRRNAHLKMPVLKEVYQFSLREEPGEDS